MERTWECVFLADNKSVSSHGLKEYSVFVLLVQDVSQSCIAGVQGWRYREHGLIVELISSNLLIFPLVASLELLF